MTSAKLRCSFCGKSEDQVKRLVAGAKALICDQCVAVADRIMKKAPDDPETKPPQWPAPPK
jgi:ATP-dependent Clp protease ATP-binding subunit ClpX